MSDTSTVDEPHAASQPPDAARRTGAAPSALGLTVHGLPEPGRAALSVRPWRGRWIMLAVLLACAAPVVASYLAYYVVRPEGRRVYGELIDPQRPLPAVATRSLSGSVQPLDALRGQWLLVTVSGGACASDCQERLFLQRQLREILGKDKDRLDRVWLLTDEAEVPAPILPGLRDATVLRLAAADLGRWLQPAPGHRIEEHLYVVDPMGNWMMRFPADLDRASAARAKRDLERLMRASASWDTAGRPPASS